MGTGVVGAGVVVFGGAGVALDGTLGGLGVARSGVRVGFLVSVGATDTVRGGVLVAERVGE